MSSETSMAAADFRFLEWAAQIRECQSRLAGMSVVSWCAFHGITKSELLLQSLSCKGSLSPHRKPKKKHGKREDDLKGLPVVVIEHSLTQDELTALFGEEGFKQLPDEVYRRYGFTPAKVEVEEHHVMTRQ